MKGYQLISETGGIKSPKVPGKGEIMDHIDETIKDILHQMRRPYSGISGGKCQSDKSISHYLNGELNGIEKEKIELHFLECEYCLDLVLFNKKIEKVIVHKALPEATQVWMERGYK